MKSLSFAPKFNQVLMVCALGVSLFGLPTAVVAQDAIGTLASVEASHASNRKIYVHHTEWMVAYASNKHDYHAVPWLFMPDGTARSGDLWQGAWYKKSKDTINISIQMNDGSKDEFVVKFTSPSRFVAYKNGQPYRYGVRK